MVSLLTYNVSWESMIAEQGGHSRKCLQEGKNVCAENIKKIITDCKCDFILIQEASGFIGFTLPDMSEIRHKSKNETQITFYNNKYTLVESVLGEFKEGRPYIIAHFKAPDATDMIVVNLHLDAAVRGTDKDQLKLTELQKLNDNLTDSIKAVLPTSKLIIAGDFNTTFSSLKDPITILGIPLTREPANIGTCCNFELKDMKFSKLDQIDHIFVSKHFKFTKFSSPAKNKALYSDHNPLQCELEIVTGGGRRKTRRIKRRRGYKHRISR